MPTLTTAEINAMRTLITDFMVDTAEHRNNPTGAASTSSVATGIAIVPINSTDRAPSQDYPIEKLFLLRETKTAYTAFQTGDFLVSGGVTYAVKAVVKGDNALGEFYSLILEETLGS